LVTQDRRSEAQNYLRQAIALHPDYWEARSLLGVEMAAQGDIAGEREQFSQVVQLKPDHVLAHLNLGVGLARQTQFQDAARAFRQALQLDPSNQVAKEYLSKLHAN